MRVHKRDGADLLFAVGLTIFFCMPYLVRDFLPFEHDTMFHCGRIAMLSEAIRHGSLLPALYPDANYGYGYASPLFYCDFFNLIPACLHAAGVPLSTCYKMLVIAMTFLSVWTMMGLGYKVCRERSVSWLAAMAYLFSNYHITDVYVRTALGEIIAIAFLPLVLEKLYCILYEHENAWRGFGIALGCLLLAHNLTFLFGTTLIVIFFFIRIANMDKKTFMVLLKGTVCAFLMTCFFSLPMLEQLHAQTLNVSLYPQYYDLSEQSVSLSQYFVNKTVYGLAGNTVEHPMVENIGWFLTFVPLLYLFVKKEEKKPFLNACLIIGWVFLLLVGEWFPWGKMHFLGFIQFPWRLNTISMLMLCLPSAYALCRICDRKKFLIAFTMGLLLMEGGYHLQGEYSRTYGINSSISWNDVRNQNGIRTYDPSRYPYKYEELQGGEYLPAGYPNFYERGDIITDESGMVSDAQMTRNYDNMQIHSKKAGKLVLPLTWYKGYTVYKVESGIKTKIPVYRNEQGLVTFTAEASADYLVKYESTMLRKVCLCISLVTLIVLILSSLHASRTMRSI